MDKLLFGLTLAAVVGLVGPALALDDDEMVPLDQLPKAVTKAIQKKFRNAELVEADKLKEDGQVLYGVTIKFKKQELDVIVTPEGKILRVEKDIEEEAIPKAVLAALKKKYPKATVKSAMEISKDDKIAEYEIEIVTKDDQHLDVTFDPKGKFIEEEKIEDEPKKGDAKDK
jgi:uncharacterized membrane protein YkoI